MASLDTVYIIQQSEEAPISDPPVTTIPVFTHTIQVPGYEATEISNGDGSVYYLPEGGFTSNLSSLPPASIVAEVTTVTVIPVPPAFSPHQQGQFNTTNHSAFSMPTSGWNGIMVGSWVGSASTAESGTGSSTANDAVSVLTVTASIATVYQTFTITETSSVPPNLGYEFVDSGASSPGSPVGFEALGKRQTCVWISATIDGQEVGWCNNWGGPGSTLTYTSWDTTSV